MTTFNIFLFLILVVCFFLIIIIMAQNPKGGGLSSTFGGNTQVVGGVQKTGTFLDNGTWFLGIALVVLILVSNTFIRSGSNGSSKILEGEQIENTQPLTNPLDDPAPVQPPADSL